MFQKLPINNSTYVICCPVGYKPGLYFVISQGWRMIYIPDLSSTSYMWPGDLPVVWPIKHELIYSRAVTPDDGLSSGGWSVIAIMSTGNRMHLSKEIIWLIYRSCRVGLSCSSDNEWNRVEYLNRRRDLWIVKKLWWWTCLRYKGTNLTSQQD